jgi:hypothetical protein
VIESLRVLLEISRHASRYSAPVSRSMRIVELLLCVFQITSADEIPFRADDAITRAVPERILPQTELTAVPWDEVFRLSGRIPTTRGKRCGGTHRSAENREYVTLVWRRASRLPPPSERFCTSHHSPTLSLTKPLTVS